ncbi:methionyl-tRNA formyltransferase [Alteribacter aurantiacus]|uniref:methionyl-tRNA formyltransferase n=1 Tax=Alteribacter aurantiacus TaxID=254410 RepID=UPI00040CE263|nr:methionyl-tRNA formyltransferase [Alteribacter aurantiacus]
MKIVFMGTPDFSVPVLQMLLKEGYDIIGVVTQPDRPKGRKRELTPPPVKVEALKHGLLVLQPERIRNEEEWKKIEIMAPDLIITAAFGQILPQGLLDVPRLGCVNVHASLLPKYRGGAPIHQAVIDGEKETGISIMYMVEALDAGDVLSQRAIPINEEDHTGTLFTKLSTLGAELLKDTLPSIQAETIQAVPQDEEKVTFAPNITKDQEVVDWGQSARDIYNHVRGLHPWPVAYTTWDGNRLKIWWTDLVDQRFDEKPGTVVQVDESGVMVVTGDQKAVTITDIQPSGKKRMDAKTFYHGQGSKLLIGTVLGGSHE